MKNKEQLVLDLRAHGYSKCCREAADRLENDEAHIQALRTEIQGLRAEIYRLTYKS